MPTTSATPGTCLNVRSTTQSCRVRSSVVVLPSPFRRYRITSPTGVALGMTLASTPGGRETPRRRSFTCCRAILTSALSSYVTTVNDSPNWVCEKTRIELGKPDSANSMGKETCFSTSSAARPGNKAITVTCVSVTSGNASTERFLNATEPAKINSKVAISTMSG